MSNEAPNQPPAPPRPDFEAARAIANEVLYHDAHIQDGADACRDDRAINDACDHRADYLTVHGSILASAYLAALDELAASRAECGRLRGQVSGLLEHCEDCGFAVPKHLAERVGR